MSSHIQPPKLCSLWSWLQLVPALKIYILLKKGSEFADSINIFSSLINVFLRYVTAKLMLSGPLCSSRTTKLIQFHRCKVWVKKELLTKTCSVDRVGTESDNICILFKRDRARREQSWGYSHPAGRKAALSSNINTPSLPCLHRPVKSTLRSPGRRTSCALWAPGVAWALTPGVSSAPVPRRSPPCLSGTGSADGDTAAIIRHVVCDWANWLLGLEGDWKHTCVCVCACVCVHIYLFYIKHTHISI
jgi:hypothetical protein